MSKVDRSALSDVDLGKTQEATGIQLSIPMPGHPVPPQLVDRTREDVAKIEKLIDEHDVVYLLMDSRESRWLPTLLGAAKEKVCSSPAPLPLRLGTQYIFLYC
jgi:hypothetical protein